MIELNRIKQWCKIEAYGLLSFFLATCGMVLILQFNGILAGATHTLAYGDLLDIYIPAIKGVCRDIIKHESIFYSWNADYGINTALFNAFYAMSPLNVLYLLFYNADEVVVTAILTIFRTGLAAFCFNKFIKESHDVKGTFSVLFSILYSLCAYQISFNILNIIWQDAMFVLPLIFLNIDRLFEGKSAKRLTFWYAYIFISQFYMGYMIGIISFAYFILMILIKQQDKTTKYKLELCVKYFFAVLGAIGISAFVWLPAFCFIINNRASDSSIYQSAAIKLTDFYEQMFWGSDNRLDSIYPNIYCGVIIHILIILFFIDNKIGFRDKIVFGLLIIVLVMACFNGVLYVFLHGFDNPDGWIYRFAYIISFLLCTIGSIESKQLVTLGNRKLIISGTIVLTLFLLVKLLRSMSLGNEFTKWDQTTVCVNACFIVLWLFLLFEYKRYSVIHKTSLGAVILLVAVIEMVSSGTRSLTQGKLIQLYKVWRSSVEELTESLPDDESYRVNVRYDLSADSGLMFGFNGVSYFASPENSQLRQSLSLLGLYSSPRVIYGYGLTPVTKMILSVKYDLESGIWDLINSDKAFEDCVGYIKQNDDVLNLGYMVSGDWNDYTFYGEDAFENNNYILSVMTGENIGVFQGLPPQDISFSGEGMEIIAEDSNYSIITDESYDSDMKYTISVSGHKNESIYAYFYNLFSGRVSAIEFFLLDGGDENGIHKNGDLSVSYIKEMEETDSGHELMIRPVGAVKEKTFRNMFFAEYNEDELKRAYSILQKEQMQIESVKDGYVRAVVSVKDDKRILFTTIPFDKGWSVKVNGEKTEIIPILNDAFISLELPGHGDYELEFKFEAQGSRAGMIASIASMLLFLTIVISDKWILNQKTEQNGN